MALAIALVVAPSSGQAKSQVEQARLSQGRVASASTMKSAQTMPSAAVIASPQVIAFVDQQFSAVDSNGDGVLTANEFEPWIARLKAAETETAETAANVNEAHAYASTAFVAADADGNGNLTRDELTQFLNQA